MTFISYRFSVWCELCVSFLSDSKMFIKFCLRLGDDAAAIVGGDLVALVPWQSGDGAHRIGYIGEADSALKEETNRRVVCSVERRGNCSLASELRLCRIQQPEAAGVGAAQTEWLHGGKIETPCDAPYPIRICDRILDT